MSLSAVIKGLSKLVRKGAMPRASMGSKAGRLFSRKSSGGSKVQPRTKAYVAGKYYKKNHGAVSSSRGLANAKDPSYSVKHRGGKKQIVSRGQMEYIKNQLIPVKDYLIRDKEHLVSDIGQCSYTWFPLGDVSDIISIFGQLGTSDPNQKFDITDAQLQLRCQNMSSAACYLKVYTCVARHDIPDSLTTIQTMLDNGFSEYKTDAEITNITVGGTVFHNSQWVNYFNVIASKEIKLDLAESVTLDLKNPRNKLINYKLIDDASPIGLLGYTQGFVVQLWGQLAASTAAGLAPTVCNTKVATLSERRYSVKLTEDSVQKGTYLIGDTLDDTASTTLINEATGAVVNPVFA